MPAQPLRLTLADALSRAQANSLPLVSAGLAARIAREDTVQARAALLPNVNWSNQFIYTQPNGTSSGVFVGNDGPHVYTNQGVVHGEIYAPGKRADYRRAMAAEAVSQAKTEIAARGLTATVVQSYYGIVSAERRLANAEQGRREAEQFLDITQKQEQGGEAAHADVVRAMVLVERRRRETQDAQLTVEKARLGLAVLAFADFRTDFTVEDDLDSVAPLPEFARIQTMAAANNPEIRAALATLEQQRHEITVARGEMLPSLSFDYFFGINANQYTIRNPEMQRNLGSAAQAQLNIPVWSWGAARSKVRQAELRLQQAQLELSVTQRQLLANVNGFYREAATANAQLGSLGRSLDLSGESLKLTLLRYQAGEVSVLEVVDAQSTLAEARTALEDGRLRYRFAIASLQTLTGAF